MRKPLLFILIPLAHIVLVGLLKWRLRPPIESLMFFAGGAIGIYFLDAAEAFFKLTPSPFRSVLFLGLFAVVSFFVVTSANSLIASGLVLSLFLTMILWQVGEWKVSGNLTSWYRMVSGSVSLETQKWILVAFICLFVVETFLFVR